MDIKDQETELALAAASSTTTDRSLPAISENRLPDTYVKAATSQNTRRAYRYDVQHFTGSGGLLPASPSPEAPTYSLR